MFKTVKKKSVMKSFTFKLKVKLFITNLKTIQNFFFFLLHWKERVRHTYSDIFRQLMVLTVNVNPIYINEVAGK